MTGQPPAFGPTDTVPADENEEPFAVVRVALAMTREQLRTALTVGHAQLSGQPALSDMDVLDVRREVEGYIATVAALTLYREGSELRLPAGLADDLDQAIDRAYTQPTPRPHQVQAPVYGPGTVTVDTLDRGRVTIPEPAWCRGHDGDLIDRYADLTHTGLTDTAEFAGVSFLPARISWAPFAEQHNEPMGDVDEFPGLTPDGLRTLAAELMLHIARLYTKAHELDRIRQEQP